MILIDVLNTLQIEFIFVISFINIQLKFKNNMYNLTKLKILVIGPEASGKTAVVNYLSQKANVL